MCVLFVSVYAHRCQQESSLRRQPAASSEFCQSCAMAVFSHCALLCRKADALEAAAEEMLAAAVVGSTDDKYAASVTRFNGEF